MKQIIIIRTDISMSSGKRCSQSAHASLSAYVDFVNKYPQIKRDWYDKSQVKITCKIKSLTEMGILFAKAQDAGIPCSLITDEGRTQFKGEKTITAVAIGPWYEEDIDKITSHLELL